MATWCVSQVLVLRRELAAAKLEVARLAGENDELSHVSGWLHTGCPEGLRRGFGIKATQNVLANREMLVSHGRDYWR